MPKPRRPDAGMCANCKRLPSAEGSVMCHGCRNSARRQVAIALQVEWGSVLVRNPIGSGTPRGELS